MLQRKSIQRLLSVFVLLAMFVISFSALANEEDMSGNTHFIQETYESALDQEEAESYPVVMDNQGNTDDERNTELNEVQTDESNDDIKLTEPENSSAV